MKTTTTLLLLAVALVTGCAEQKDPQSLVDRAIEAMGGRDALSSVTSVYLKLEGELIPPGEDPTRTPYKAEHRITLPDEFAIRVQVAGLDTWKAVKGGKAWIRSGAAVFDLIDERAAEEMADRDDYLVMLLAPALDRGFKAEPGSNPNQVRLLAPDGTARLVEFDPETGLPTRMERAAIGTKSKDELMVRHFKSWGSGEIRLPTEIHVELAGSHLELTVKESVVNGKDDHGLTGVRPNDQAEPKTEKIRRDRERGGNYVVVVHKGRLTDLAQVDLLIERGLRDAMASRKGPIRRVFRKLPDADGIAVVETRVPVSLSHDAAARDLPRGVGVVSISAVDILAMRFTGPYPRTRDLEQILKNFGEGRGLEPAGPAYYMVLSSPNKGDPADLVQEIRLPVRIPE